MPPHAVFSRPSVFRLERVPAFYSALLSAWVVCKGSFSSSSLGIGVGIDFCPVSSITTKSTYLYLLSERCRPPHCVSKGAFD